MATSQQWKEFHYPQPPKTTKNKGQKTYKLIDVVNNTIIVQGDYPLCVFNQKKLTIKTKIIAI